MKLCKCGCGQEVTREGNRYIRGHSNKGKKDSIETRKRKSKSKKGENHPFYNKNFSKEHREKIGLSHIGKKCSEETKRKISESVYGEKNGNYGMLGENHPTWKGGSSDYWHSKAWKLFGKNYCEICHIDINTYMEKTNQRFDMHNTLEPKDYTVMEPYVWQCLCHSCHMVIEESL